MATAKQQFEAIFTKLDLAVGKLNEALREEGLAVYAKSEIKILGQVSLLMDEKVALKLAIAQTADLDAQLKIEYNVKELLRSILLENGYVYDEDSPYIWIPPGAKFIELFDLDRVHVTTLDPESALVSKAIKATEKNKILIRQALASGLFPNLAERILANGGDLESFI